MKEDRKKAVIEAYRQTLANASLACKACGINRDTFYTWLKNDAEFARQIEDIRNNDVCDFIEDALMNKIKEGDTTAIIFASKTRLKHRGYVERQEQVIVGNPFEDLMKRLPDPEEK